MLRINSKNISKEQCKELENLIKSQNYNVDLINKEFNLIFEGYEKPEILYHYTSLSTLQAILDNIDKEKQNDDSFILRATPIEYLNDITEFELGAKLMTELVKEYEVENSIPSNQIKSNNITIENWKNATSFGHSFTSPFIISFSENSDNLPMWNTYGNSGYGVAVGIERASLENLDYNGITNNPELHKCIYDHNNFKTSLFGIRKDLYNTFVFNEEYLQVNGILELPVLGIQISRLKHNSYEYEKEWRLIKLCSDYDTNKEIRTHAKEDIIKPYIENRLPKSSLKEIIIGPCSNLELTRKSIEISLKRVGYKIENKFNVGEKGVKLKISKVPFRHI